MPDQLASAVLVSVSSFPQPGCLSAHFDRPLCLTADDSAAQSQCMSTAGNVAVLLLHSFPHLHTHLLTLSAENVKFPNTRLIAYRSGSIIEKATSVAFMITVLASEKLKDFNACQTFGAKEILRCSCKVRARKLACSPIW